MDLNICSALWCAAHAAGRLRYPQLPAWRSAARRRAVPKIAAGPVSGAEDTADDGARRAAETAAAPVAAAAAVRAAASSEDSPWRPAGEGAHYRSCARIALLGHGADEQCGGYGRHRTTFRHKVQSHNKY